MLRGSELGYISQVLDGRRLAAGGTFAAKTERLIAEKMGAAKVFLTHSCTAALEIAALLTVRPGDEVILPSFTYATTGSAFARCGARLVFVDIREDTLNIDPEAVAAAISPKTRVIVGVHYAGVACDVEALAGLAAAAGGVFVEDAAHAFGARINGRQLGTFGQLGAFSFHETKNLTSGEGGALMVNDAGFIDRAQTIHDRGTNRARFLSGQINAYEWVDLGSTFAPPEIVAAFLLAQIEASESVTEERIRLWQFYHDHLEVLEQAGIVRRPRIPAGVQHNGHIYYLLLADPTRRQEAVRRLAEEEGIQTAFHYVPLHRSPAGTSFGRAVGSLAVTDRIAAGMIRLPLHLGLSPDDQQRVVEAVLRVLGRR